MDTIVAITGRRPLELLGELGRRSVLVDEEIPFDMALLADVPVQADLANWDQTEAALSAIHDRTPVAAVLGTLETRLVLASYLAERLGARGLALAGALNCFDKLRTRRALEAAGIAGPRYAGVLDPDGAVAAAAGLGWPVVLKPNDGTGGDGVWLCDDADAVRVAARSLVERGTAERPQQILVEEYLNGQEYSVLAITEGGRTEVINVIEATFSPPPRFVVLEARCPARLGCAQFVELVELIQGTLAALGVDNAVTHTQLRWTADGPKLIEVNTRPPGGQIVRLTEAVSGIDLLRASVEVAVGHPLSRAVPAARHGLYRSLVFPQAGILHYREEVEEQGVDGLESPVPPVIELDIHPGETVLPMVRGGVYGRVAVFGRDPDQLERDYQRVLDVLELRLEPLPEGADGAATKAVKKCC